MEDKQLGSFKALLHWLEILISFDMENGKTWDLHLEFDKDAEEDLSDSRREM